MVDNHWNGSANEADFAYGNSLGCTAEPETMRCIKWMKTKWLGRSPKRISGGNKMTSYKYFKDEHGISHIKFTTWQGIGFLLKGIKDRLERLRNLRPFLLPKTYRVSKGIDREWVIAEFMIGDIGTGAPCDFLVRVSLNDWVGEKEPSIWESILWVTDCIFPTALRVPMLSCYTPDGYYIGDLKTAATIYYGWRLTEVQPFAAAAYEKEEYCKRENINCSIGFDKENQKWIGWSEWAAGAFGIGHVVEEGNCEASSGFTEDFIKENPEADLSMPVGFEVKTLEDAKRCAIAFAENVS